MRRVKAFLVGLLLAVLGIGLLVTLIIGFLALLPLFLILLGLLIAAAALGKGEIRITHLDQGGQNTRPPRTRCIYCGAEIPPVAGRCPECGKRNPFVESS